MSQELVANFELSDGQQFDALFEINAAGTTWGSIDGTLSNQTDLQAALDLKADKTTVQADLEALNDTITENYDTLDSKIDSVQSDLSGDISALSETVTNNNTALNARINETNTNVTNLTATVTDNYSDLNGKITSLTGTVNSNYNALNANIQNEAAQRAENDSLLQENINAVVDNLNSEISARESADTNLQTQITNLSGTVSSSYNTLDNKIDGVNTSLQAELNTLENTVNANTNSISALNTTVSNLNDTVQSNYTILDTKIDTTKADLQGNIDTLSGTVTSNYNDLSSAITSSASTINSRIDSEVSTLETSINSEATSRENADNNLQSQIDAITAASDVVDIVGTYAALQAYNTSNLQNNDIVKVLSDESRNDETTYYRWVITDGVGAWSFIGEEGPYYTKSEADSQFVPQTRTVNNRPLSSNITLSYSDVNALPNTTTIGDGILTLQKNGVDIDSFSANATTDKSINLEITSSDVTSALGYTPYNNTNPNGYITSASIMDYYGTCATAATTKAKVVNCPNFELKIGVSIRVKFTNSQTYNGSATLNVNNTGAIVVRSSGTANSIRYCWYTGEVVAFTYDGEYYVMEDSHIASTTYYGYTRLSSSAASTSASMALTPAALNSSLQYTTTGIPIYSATSTYKVGDKARYTYYMYECNTDINEPEAWNAEHWTVLDPLLTQIERKQDILTAGSGIQIVDNVISADVPEIGNGTVTLTQGGINKGSFTLNQTGNTTIDLDTSGGSITVDSELSSTSENPVQNKVITAALNNKQDVFVAEYGVTTYNEIKTAYDAEKLVKCIIPADEDEGEGEYVTTTVIVEDGYIQFTFWNGRQCRFAQVDDNDNWELDDFVVAETALQIVNSTTEGNIYLQDSVSLYKLTPISATTLSFANNTSASSSHIYTFELWVDMSSAVYTLTFPSSVVWQDGETPDMSETGTYFFAFRTIDGGSTWLGNLQGRW